MPRETVSFLGGFASTMERKDTFSGQSDDKFLLERAQAYDPVALGEIYDKYAPRIYKYVYYRIGNADLAEDLTSGVFTKMLEAIQSSKAWRVSFSGWLYRIAHNMVVDHFRRRPKERELPLDERLVAADNDPERAAEIALTSERLRDAVNLLTYDQAQVITLKFAEGMSNAEVAQILGKTEGAIKSLQYRALGALRKQLEADEKRVKAS